MNRKRYAVVFRYDQDKKPDLIEVNESIDEDGCFDMSPTSSELIRLPEDNHFEGSTISSGPLNGNIRGYFICDDKPSDACFRDGDTNKNGWHPRMFGDFALIVESKTEAEWLQKHATPMVWFA
jgi:hypothetical protein